MRAESGRAGAVQVVGERELVCDLTSVLTFPGCFSAKSGAQVEKGRSSRSPVV